MVTRLSTAGGRRYRQFGSTAALVMSLASVGTAPVVTARASGGLPTGWRGRHYGSLRTVNPSVLSMLPSVGSPSGGGGGGGGSSSSGFSRALVVNNSMEPLKQNAARNLMVFLVQSADHVTGLSGLGSSLTVSASKDGGVFNTITPTVTERGNGWYKVALASADTDTLGDLALHITGTGGDPCDLKLPVEVDRTGITATNNDKTGYSLSAASVQAIWDALTSALTTAGSIGKKFADFVLGSDSKVILSNNAHSGAVVPTVTTVTDLTVTGASEPGSVPGPSASLANKISFLFALARNRITQTASLQSLRNDGDTANIGSAGTSDDGTTFTRNKFT